MKIFIWYWCRELSYLMKNESNIKIILLALKSKSLVSPSQLAHQPYPFLIICHLWYPSKSLTLIVTFKTFSFFQRKEFRPKSLFIYVHSLLLFSTRGMIVIFFSFFIFNIYIKYETSSNGSIQSEGNSQMFSPISWPSDQQTDSDPFLRLIKNILTSLFFFGDSPALEP